MLCVLSINATPLLVAPELGRWSTICHQRALRDTAWPLSCQPPSEPTGRESPRGGRDGDGFLPSRDLGTHKPRAHESGHPTFLLSPLAYTNTDAADLRAVTGARRAASPLHAA